MRFKILLHVGVGSKIRDFIDSSAASFNLPLLDEIPKCVLRLIFLAHSFIASCKPSTAH